MNSQERAILEPFLGQLVDIHGIAKDPEADQLISTAVERQPDASYLLVQRVLLLDQALDRARARIAELESTPGPSNVEFLGSASAWPTASSRPAAAGASVSPPVRAAAPQFAGPSYAAPASQPAGSGFLGQAAATAAGVAGGAFLFQGIEELLGHHGDAFAGQGTTALPAEDVTVNNYYANERAGEPDDASFLDTGQDIDSDDANDDAGGDFV